MIYPHQIREDAHIEPTKLALCPYAISFAFIWDGKWQHKAGSVPAIDLPDAVKRAQVMGKQLYPECQGYFNVTIDVVPVEWLGTVDSQLAKAEYSRD